MKRKRSQFFCLYGEEGAHFLPSHCTFSFSSSLPSSFASWIAWCTAKGLMNICFVPDTVSGALEKLLFNTPNNSQIILPLVFEGGNRSWKKSGKWHKRCIPAVKTSLQLGRSDSKVCILPAINLLIFFAYMKCQRIVSRSFDREFSWGETNDFKTVWPKNGSGRQNCMVKISVWRRPKRHKW